MEKKIEKNHCGQLCREIISPHSQKVEKPLTFTSMVLLAFPSTVMGCAISLPEVLEGLAHDPDFN